MIRLTRLNGTDIVINLDLIKFIEATPDTMISLSTGDKIIVREPVDEVVEQAIQFKRLVSMTVMKALEI